MLCIFSVLTKICRPYCMCVWGAEKSQGRLYEGGGGSVAAVFHLPTSFILLQYICWINFFSPTRKHTPLVSMPAFLLSNLSIPLFQPYFLYSLISPVFPLSLIHHIPYSLSCFFASLLTTGGGCWNCYSMYWGVLLDLVLKISSSFWLGYWTSLMVPSIIK